MHTMIDFQFMKVVNLNDIFIESCYEQKAIELKNA